MLELLSPAGSPEAVIAAVQNGADAVYLGFGDYNARRGAKNFTGEEFEKAVRYCRVRGCKVYATLNTLVNDREVEDALAAEVLLTAAHHGASFIINLAGAEAAAEMGMTRVVLARELNLEQIRFITKNASVETEVFVHGALCFCYSGQCYMSALIGRRSGNRGMCAQPCRMQYSLGGRMDDYPLSLKDNCLISRLQELEDAGVACIKIEGRMKRPEYTAIVTDIYHRALTEHRQPTKEEMEMLENAFSRNGFTQGYFDGDKQNMFGVRGEPAEDTEKLFAATRRAYGDGEMRRVPVHFYTVCRKEEPIRAIAFDDDGNKAVAEGPVPEKAKRQGLTDAYIVEQMYKTGGTPFHVVENKAQTDPGLFVSAADINEMRRSLIATLSEKRGKAPERKGGSIPALPKNVAAVTDPKMIFQVRTEDQLTEELAELKPAYLYVPAQLMLDRFELLKPFTDRGAVPVAVMPRIITDNQVQEVTKLLRALREKGIREALAGNLGHVYFARNAGMEVRGDFGLNVFNSFSLGVLQEAGLKSVTASFELRLAQIKDLSKPIDTEIIVYGRLPLMVSEQCVIKESAGHCACQTPGQLAGCRNVIYNAHKLYLADKREDIFGAGLWGQRMLFTTESGRECAEVARGYLGISDYKPNVLTRGLYYRGVD